MNIFTLSGTIAINNAQAKQALGETEQHANKFSQGFGKAMKAVGIGILAVGTTLVALSKQSIDAYIEQENAEKRLNTLMMNVTGTTKEQVQAVMDLAQARQALTTVGDEATMQGASQLATFRLEGDQIQSLIPSLQDLAVAQYGVNVTGDQMQQSANMMGKVLDGQTGALKRCGVSLSAEQEELLKTGDRTQKVAVLVEVLKDNFGGLAEEMATTTQGKMIQLQNTIGDIKETLGVKFLPIIEKITTLIKEHLPAIAEVLGKVFDAFIPVIGELLELLIPMVEGFLPAMMDLFTKLMGQIMPPLNKIFKEFVEKALPPLMKLLTIIVDEILPPFIDIFLMIIDTILPPFLEILSVIVDVILPPFVEFFRMLVDTILPPLVEIFNLLIATVLPPFVEILGLIMEAIKPFLGKIGELLKQLMPPLIKIFKELIELVLPPLMDLLVMFCEYILPPLMKALTWLVENVLELVIKSLNFLADVVIPKVIQFFTNFKNHIQTVGDFFVGIWNGIMELWNGVVLFFQNIWTNIQLGIEGFKLKFLEVWEAIKNGVKGFINGIIGGLNGMVSGVERAINWVISALNRIHFKFPDWIPGLGGKEFGFNIKEVSFGRIPLLEKGGRILQEGLAIVGERGAELVNLPKGAEVRPIEKAGATITNYFYSPKPISERDARRNIELVSRKLAMEGVL